MTQDEFLRRVSLVESKEEALEVIALIYPKNVCNSEAFYHDSAIARMGWESFYAVREMEDRFGAGSFSSAYIATVLSFPKISLLYSEIAGSVQQEKSDFCGRVLDMTATKLIPEWDKEKNDNFFAYMLPNLLTVRNAILAEDGGPSKYLKQKKGLTLTSIESMAENAKKQSNTTRGTWEPSDPDKNTEEEALFRMKGKKLSLLRKVVGLSGEGATVTDDNIWASIVCRKLFHGEDEEELSMLEDPDISGALSLYFDKSDKDTSSKFEEQETEMVLA